MMADAVLDPVVEDDSIFDVVGRFCENENAHFHRPVNLS
jgi:hypothetical protein